MGGWGGVGGWAGGWVGGAYRASLWPSAATNTQQARTSARKRVKESSFMVVVGVGVVDCVVCEVWGGV